MDSVAIRYSESLFDLAVEEDKVEQYSTDIELVDEVLNDPKITRFFSHVQIKDEDKISLIDKSFKGQVSPYVLNFLKVLVKKRRFNYLNEIIKSFKEQTNEYLGIEEGFVYSSYPLEDEQVKKLEEAMSKKLDKTVKLEAKVDESLIGGIKVEINNRVYDDSIKNKVSQLKKQILRK